MYKVLIVDDEPLVIRGLVKQINWDHFNMELAGTAVNGVDALTQLENNRFDLLIVDVCMPYMDGLTLIAKVKAIQPSLRCIVVSAFTEFEYVKKALQLGVENYLLKPLNDSELQETLSQTLNNLERDQKLVTPQLPDLLAFRNNILDRWVHGTIQDFELFERAEILNINLSAPEYRVCVLNFWTTTDIEDRMKYSSMLLNICRNHIGSICNGEFFLDSSFYVVLILFGEGLGQLNPQLISSFQQMQEAATVLGIRTFATVGSHSVTSTQVSSSYSSAVLYQSYRLLDCSSTYIFVEDFLNMHNEIHTPETAKSLQLQLSKVLNGGNLEQIIINTRKMIDQHENAPIRSLKNEILPLVFSLIRAMSESGRKSDALSEFVLDHLAKFVFISNSIDLKLWIVQTINDMNHVIRERKGSFHLLVNRTLEQINKNYHTDLSLKTLAASYNVSPPYLGHLFKEETGKYFNDYLTEVRLQASIAYLLETNMKIGEIILKIGIPNQSYYNRVFKKTFGASPLEFRRQDLHRFPLGT